MDNVQIPENVNLHMSLGGNGTCPNHYKVRFQVCLGGNGTCPDFRKNEF